MPSRRAKAIVVGLAVGLAFSLGATAPSRAELSDDLRRVADLRIDEARVYDGTGSAVAEVGDVSGDGVPDMLIGAGWADNNGREDSGSAYVVFGGSTGSLELAALGRRGFRIDGAVQGGRSGTAVAGAGDVNGDGVPDMLIGAPGAGNVGATFVVFGGSTADLDLAALGRRGFRIDGAAEGANTGASVAGAGDVDGDGFDDLLIGASRPRLSSSAYSAYLVFGGSSSDVDLAALGQRGFRIDGSAGGVRNLAMTVAGAGDVNGDGVPDMLIGLPEADLHGRPNSGSSYVVFGGSRVNVDLAALGQRGFRIDGAAEGDRSGAAVAGAGDVNGDGFDDVVIGAPEADGDGKNSGTAYVVFGGSTADVDLAAPGHRGLRINKAPKYASCGAAVAGAGDVNGDGFDDVLIGAPGAANSGIQGSGSTYLLFGGSVEDVNLSRLGNRAFRIDGDALGESSGAAVAGPGDIDGDGFNDMLIGAPGGYGDEPAVRSVYRVRGGPPATLRVTARKATKKLRRTGRTTLVKRIAVGAGQMASVGVKVSPKKARASVTVKKSRNRVVVRTKRTSKKATIEVRIASRGQGRLTRTWQRTWRMIGSPKPAKTKSAPALLALGDSWAAGQWDKDWMGYVNRFADDLRTQRLCRSAKGALTDCDGLEVHNLAMAGATTDMLIKQRLSDAVDLIKGRKADKRPANDVVVTVLTIGGLDVFDPSLRACSDGVTDGCRQTLRASLATAEANLDVILQSLRSAAGPKGRIVVTTYDNPIPHCYAAAIGLSATGAVVLEGDSDLGVPAGLNDTIRKVAASHGVEVAETYGRLRAGDWVGATDCLHPVGSGHEKIARAALRALGLKATGPGQVRVRKPQVADGKVRLVWREARRAKRYAVRISGPGGKTFEKWTVQKKRTYVRMVEKKKQYRIQVRGVGPGGRGPIATVSFRG